ncbi:MAG: efflux transporter permease subunit [Paenibacillus sp.]|nr:efflux transporter permease subunit [Paenibacillus sp.]
MGSIIRFSLNNKFAILILTMIIVAAGLYAGLHMKKETIPNIEVPFLTVSAVMPGAAPQEVAERLSEPLMKAIKNSSGVGSVSSTSMESASSLIVEYEFGQSMDEAQNKLTQALATFAKPEGVQEIKVSKISLNDFPVVSVSISRQDGKLEELTKLVEGELKASLAGIEGVGTVGISGQYVQEVQLTFDRSKMNALGVSADTVKAIVQGSAVKAPLGLFELDHSEKTVVVDGGIDTIDDLKNVSIPLIPAASGAALGVPPAAGGIPTIKLADIADIRLVGRAESVSRTNGSVSIGINVTKSSDANTVDVVSAVKEQVEQFKSAHEADGVEALIMLDQGEPIEQSINTMMSKALFGALFAVIVILLFLRNVRTTIISIVSIPLSLLIALVVLKQSNVTLNVMTLGAMTVAIGRVVDDSIVVIENNFRRMGLSTEKLTGKALVLDATKEMFIPILSSTLVTIAVFVPLGLVSGPIGQLFMPFALTMVYALLSSLLVAITVVPALAHFMLSRRGKRRGHEDKPGAIAGFYRRVLSWTLRHKAITSIIAVVLLAASLGLAGTVGFSFLPEEEEKYTMITYSPGPGKRLADVEAAALEAEELILDRPGVVNLQYSVGGQSPMGGGSSKSALFYVQYANETEHFKDEKKALIASLQKLDNTGKWGELSFGGGIGGGGLSLVVYGESMEQLKPEVGRILDALQKEGSFEKVQSSMARTYEQYTIAADQQKLARLGLSAGQIAMKLAPVRVRPVLTEVSVGNEPYNVYEQMDTQPFATIADIENTKLASPLGFEVPIKEVAVVEKGTSANTITHKDGRLYVEVTADITTKDVGKASTAAKAQIDALGLPSGIEVEYGGVTAQMNETFTQLGLAMAAAVAIVYLLLVITFGGGLTPFAILFSLPFTVIGGLAALYLAGETISASAMMGALMLIGIVVTNAIVLLDRVLHMERDGMSTREALLEAGTTRLRPILMTALATVGALLPLALGFESTSGSLISKGLGVTVIGGLISSTLLTLVIVPIVYEFLSRFRRKRRLNRDEW